MSIRLPMVLLCRLHLSLISNSRRSYSSNLENKTPLVASFTFFLPTDFITASMLSTSIVMTEAMVDAFSIKHVISLCFITPMSMCSPITCLFVLYPTLSSLFSKPFITNNRSLSITTSSDVLLPPFCPAKSYTLRHCLVK